MPSEGLVEWFGKEVQDDGTNVNIRARRSTTYLYSSTECYFFDEGSGDVVKWMCVI
jgi:hypothetical protein